MRGRRRRPERIRRRAGFKRALAIDRLAMRVHDPAEPGSRRAHGGGRIGNDGPAAAADALDGGKGHHDRIVAGEADHLARDAAIYSGFDGEAGADRHRVNGSGDLDHEAPNGRNTPINQGSVEFRDLFCQGLHGESPLNRPSPCLPDLYRLR
jgi:hypothetical protein